LILQDSRIFVALRPPDEDITERVTFWVGRVVKAISHKEFQYEYYHSPTGDNGVFHLWDYGGIETTDLYSVLLYGENFLTQKNKVKQKVLDKINRSWDEVKLLEAI
jgi:hypothetical protein